MVATALAVVGLMRRGTEFRPRLDEGSVLVQVRRLPATALSEGVRFSGMVERALIALPEVQTVVSKLGRPDLATEAMGSYESDTYVILTEKESWRKGGKAAIVQAIGQAGALVPFADNEAIARWLAVKAGIDGSGGGAGGFAAGGGAGAPAWAARYCISVLLWCCKAT